VSCAAGGLTGTAPKYSRRSPVATGPISCLMSRPTLRQSRLCSCLGRGEASRTTLASPRTSCSLFQAEWAKLAYQRQRLAHWHSIHKAPSETYQRRSKGQLHVRTLFHAPAPYAAYRHDGPRHVAQGRKDGEACRKRWRIEQPHGGYRRWKRTLPQNGRRLNETRSSKLTSNKSCALEDRVPAASAFSARNVRMQLISQPRSHTTCIQRLRSHRCDGRSTGPRVD
jgi:hypothetical protein